MNKLLFILIAATFSATSFPATDQDNQTSTEQVAARKETSEPQVKKETAHQYNAGAKSYAKYTAAHRNGKTVSSKRRPMFK